MTKRKLLEQVLRFMAKAVLAKYGPLVVGVTGSVGKSSTKEAIALVLSSQFHVRKSEGNYNNEVGIPLTILGAKSGGSSIIRWVGVFFRFLWLMLVPTRYPQVVVLEMGIDRPGDMEYLLSFIPVKVGVATGVSSSHMEFFGSITNIAREKGRLIATLPEDGFAILNADDKRTAKMAEKTKAKVLTYGFADGASVRADNILFHREAKRVEGYGLKLNFDGKTIPVRLPKIIGRHHIPAALAAAAVGLSLKMNLVEIAGALERFEPLPGRLRLLPGRENTVLIDDTYNASPTSTVAALETLRELSAPRKIAVLGDMLELGPESDRAHAALKDAVIDSQASMVVTVGKHMRSLYDALMEAGFPPLQVLWLPDPLSAIQMLLKIVHPEDLILIKGSQGLRMETIVEQLLIDPKEAPMLLCRQAEEWRKKPFTPPTEWTE